MIAALSIATALVAAPQDKWELKAPIAPKTTHTWSLKIEAKPDGEDHQATFKMVQEMKDREEGKPAKARILWKDLLVDGNSVGEDPEWDVDLSDAGAVVKTSSEDDDIRRMLTPLLLSYPSGAVGVGDKWETSTGSGDATATTRFTVAGIEKVKDVEALKVTSELREKGGTAMEADGTWWIGRDGRPLKFSVKVKNWVVPMSGSEPFEAKIEGELAP